MRMLYHIVTPSYNLDTLNRTCNGWTRQVHCPISLRRVMRSSPHLAAACYAFIASSRCGVLYVHRLISLRRVMRSSPHLAAACFAFIASSRCGVSSPHLAAAYYAFIASSRCGALCVHRLISPCSRISLTDTSILWSSGLVLPVFGPAAQFFEPLDPLPRPSRPRRRSRRRPRWRSRR